MKCKDIIEKFSTENGATPELINFYDLVLHRKLIILDGVVYKIIHNCYFPINDGELLKMIKEGEK